MQNAIEKIARETLMVDSLEEQRVDDLDFHDLHVGLIADALRRAYEAGKAAAK